MAAWQRWNRGDKVSSRILFNNHIKLLVSHFNLHWRVISNSTAMYLVAAPVNSVLGKRLLGSGFGDGARLASPWVKFFTR